MQKSSYSTIRRFVLVNMIILPLLPFLLALGIGNHSFSSSIENHTHATMQRIADDHRQMIESFLQERYNDLELIIRTTPFSELIAPSTLATTFERLQQTASAFVDLGIFDETGLHRAYHGPYDLSGKLYKDTLWFQKTLANGVFISDVFLGYRNIPHFVIAVAGRESGRAWVIRATVDSQRFSNLVRRIRIGKTGEAYLLNRQGVLQTDRRSGGNLMESPREEIPRPPDNLKTHTFIQRHGEGEAFLYATTWLNDRNWLLVVRQEKSDAFRALRSAQMPILFITLVGGGCIVVAAFTLTGAIVRKMERTDSEKELLSQQLIGASRLAELGEMAAGFAHEINNPLQIMSAELSLIRELKSDLRTSGATADETASEEMDDSIDQIKIQIERCSRITASILKFGRQGEAMPVRMNLVSAVPEIVRMVKKKAEVSGIRLELDLPDRPLHVFADASRLQQVVLNLLNNAMDAVISRHGSAGGVVSIRVAAQADGTVSIDIVDNGVGIGTDNLKKVFTPFFTTKPVGQGTGLGLSVCFGIIRQMGGNMDVASTEGRGTTFSIGLPLMATEPAAA